MQDLFDERPEQASTGVSSKGRTKEKNEKNEKKVKKEKKDKNDKKEKQKSKKAEQTPKETSIDPAQQLLESCTCVCELCSAKASQAGHRLSIAVTLGLMASNLS